MRMLIIFRSHIKTNGNFKIEIKINITSIVLFLLGINLKREKSLFFTIFVSFSKPQSDFLLICFQIQKFLFFVLLFLSLTPQPRFFLIFLYSF
jgi:hypothetical protein